MKTKIKVPKNKEELAVILGAKYDKWMKSWYVPADVLLYKFNEFIPLTIDVIPQSAWGKNVRSENNEAWDLLRKQTYKLANHTCEICGATSQQMEAHEVWSYDGIGKIQILVKLICLCHLCHRTKHWGLAVISNEEDMVKKHILEINSWTNEDLERHLTESFYINEIRSQYEWTLDLSLIENYKV